jgi:hypothetical protein
MTTAQGDSRRPFRAADVVAHGPSGETWVLACDEFSDSVWPAGYPETRAAATDCTLITPATDAERVDMLTRAAAITGADYRRRLAAHQLTQEGGNHVE